MKTSILALRTWTVIILGKFPVWTKKNSYCQADRSRRSGLPAYDNNGYFHVVSVFEGKNSTKWRLGPSRLDEVFL